MQTKIVVLGGGYAGTLAALRLAGKSKQANADVLLINGSDRFVERIRHHQAAAGQTLRTLRLPEFLAGSGVCFCQGWCTTIDPANQQLVVQTATGAEEIHYDYLIYALGSTVEKVSLAGDLTNIYTLGDPQTVQALAARIATLATNRERLLVIGGGLTGIEAAAEFAEQYPTLRVTLATRGTFDAAFSAAGAAHLRRVFTRLGIELLEEVTVDEVTAHRARCNDGREIPFAAALWAGSFVVPQLATTAGLPVNGQGRLLVDPCLRVQEHPEIYAAGDAAATPLRMACATAMPMGAYVADHLAAQVLQQPTPAPFQFGYFMQCISLGRRNGLIQFVQEDDRPKAWVLTGLAAARVKEFICRYTIWSLWLEKRWPGMYSWLRSAAVVTKATAQNEPASLQHPQTAVG